MLPTKITVKIGCAVLLSRFLEAWKNWTFSHRSCQINRVGSWWHGCLLDFFLIHVVWCYLTCLRLQFQFPLDSDWHGQTAHSNFQGKVALWCLWCARDVLSKSVAKTPGSQHLRSFFFLGVVEPTTTQNTAQGTPCCSRLAGYFWWSGSLALFACGFDLVL